MVKNVYMVGHLPVIDSSQGLQLEEGWEETSWTHSSRLVTWP